MLGEKHGEVSLSSLSASICALQYEHSFSVPDISEDGNKGTVSRLNQDSTVVPPDVVNHPPTDHSSGHALQKARRFFEFQKYLFADVALDTALDEASSVSYSAMSPRLQDVVCVFS